MAKTSVGNEANGPLCLWVAPWVTDHRMRPGTVFTVDTEAKPEQAPFNVVVHDPGVTVGVNVGFATEVIDQDGVPVTCGHQHPEDFDGYSRWVVRWTKSRGAPSGSGPEPYA